MSAIAAVVLAAGGSKRLGRPKQLLLFRGETLIRRVVRAAQEAGCAPIVVVVGREHEEVARELKQLPVTFVPNEKWERGLGTSIRAGVERVAPAEEVILLACDQPYVEATVLRELIEKHRQSGKAMVASAYAGTVGVPALFAAECFEQLRSLGDDEGAKTLLRSAPGDVATVDFAAGACDIDTEADYASALSE